MEVFQESSLRAVFGSADLGFQEHVRELQRNISPVKSIYLNNLQSFKQLDLKTQHTELRQIVLPQSQDTIDFDVSPYQLKRRVCRVFTFWTTPSTMSISPLRHLMVRRA